MYMYFFLFISRRPPSTTRSAPRCPYTTPFQSPFGDRSGVVIEPWLTDQGYVDAEKLAFAPMQAVRDGRIEIVPKTWEKTFFNWMENIQPWCVSRQLWWGDRKSVV